MRSIGTCFGFTTSLVLVLCAAKVLAGPPKADVIESPECIAARKAASSAASEIGNTAGKAWRVNNAINMIECVCSGPQQTPNNSSEAKAIARHRVECERNQKRRETGWQRQATKARYEGARIIDCNSEGCNTTAGRMRGSYNSLKGPQGIVCKGRSGILECQ